MPDWFKKAFDVSEWFTSLALTSAADLMDNAIGENSINAIIKMLSMGSNGYGFDSFWSLVSSALEVVEPFGYALITTYFLMHLFDSAAKDQITIDGLIKVLIQLVLIVALVNNLRLIVNQFLSIGEGILISLQAKLTVDSDMTNLGKGVDIVNKWYENGHNPAVIWFQSLILYLIHMISVIAIAFAAIQRMLELGWRIALAPVKLADSFEGGANSNGIKYLRSLFMTAIANAMIFIVVAAGFALVKVFIGISNDNDNNIWFAMAAMFATAGAAIGISSKIQSA